MAPRLDLHAKFVEILGSEHVYFQPPTNVKMVYPCIVYTTDFLLSDWANNEPYAKNKRYLVTVIDRDPDSAIPGAVQGLPQCVYDRFYTADNLNHNVFKLFF